MMVPEQIAVYRKCLTKLRYGCPLYEPDPGCHDHVQIGDVGYVDPSFGHFCPVFNAFFNAEAPINKEFGTPDGFIPLSENLRGRRRATEHAKGIYCKGISIDKSVGFHIEGQVSPNI